MSDGFDKLKGHSDKKQDINRRAQKGFSHKETQRLGKRLDDVTRVISDPDVWNVNIASRERIDALEQRVLELEKRLREKDSAIGNGISPALQKLLDEKRAQNK